MSSRNTSRFIYSLSIAKRGCQFWRCCLKDSAQLPQTDITLHKHLRKHLKDHTKYDQGPEIHGKPRRMSLLVGKARLAECLKLWVSGPCRVGRRHPVTMRKASFRTTVYEASVRAATPDSYFQL